MTLDEAIRETGIAKTWEQGLVGIVDQAQRWQFAFTDGQFILGQESLFAGGESWQSCRSDEPLLLVALEIIDRPVRRVGRLIDLVMEDVPAYIESPQGRALYFFDGKKFWTRLLVDEAVLFDRGWKIRQGHRPLKVVFV